MVSFQHGINRLLCEVVVNFQNTQEEVTLCVQPDSISLKNYVDDEPGKLLKIFVTSVSYVVFAVHYLNVAFCLIWTQISWFIFNRSTFFPVIFFLY